MNQLTFKFPFKTTYYEKDFYVSSNNFSAYRLLESWPDWPDKWINIFGPTGCGKTHLSNIFMKKIKSVYIEAVNFKDYEIIGKIENQNCLIIDNYKNNIEEKEFYSILNFLKQSNKYLLINSLSPIKKEKIDLKDLKSRFDSFLDIGIGLPTDDLIRVILVKSFSDKQINVSIRLLEYILINIDRSYEKIFQFIKDIDKESLSSGKSININLIKKVLNK
jgi:chromosomal replication initiation ATPase DnaA